MPPVTMSRNIIQFHCLTFETLYRISVSQVILKYLKMIIFDIFDTKKNLVRRLSVWKWMVSSKFEIQTGMRKMMYWCNKNYNTVYIQNHFCCSHQFPFISCLCYHDSFIVFSYFAWILLLIIAVYVLIWAINFVANCRMLSRSYHKILADMWDRMFNKMKTRFFRTLDSMYCAILRKIIC